MMTTVRAVVATATVCAGLLAPAAVASADALTLSPAPQPADVAAGSTGATGSINTGPTGTGSFDPSPTGSSNVIKALQTGSGDCGPMVFPSGDGTRAPWCVLYH